MTLRDWADETKAKVDRYGAARGLRSGAYDLWGGLLRRACRRAGLDQSGESVFAYDWDLLVILDTCRPDVLAEVADEYEFLSEYNPKKETIESIGSTSFEWMAKTFGGTTRETLAETAYVCANGHASKFGDKLPAAGRDLLRLDRLWEYGWDDEAGCVPPDVVTDSAIRLGRESLSPDRTIVHYMQPHAPYRSLDPVDRQSAAERDQVRATVWDLLQIGELSREEVWEAYRDNLRWVLDDGVKPLLQNFDADRVVLTSDHGEMFGRRGLYGHFRHIPTTELRTVPWATTSATDLHSRDPKPVDKRSRSITDDGEIENRLRSLGYRE